jgi:hypothetical protein
VDLSLDHINYIIFQPLTDIIMKKLLVSFVVVSMFGFRQAMSQEVAVSGKAAKAETFMVSNDEEKEITFAQLPTQVQKAMKADEYKSWEVNKVWHIKKDGKEYYKLEVEKEGETSKLKFDKDGKPWDKKGDKKAM